jgi:ActR/RegA family two-component response regulator
MHKQTVLAIANDERTRRAIRAGLPSRRYTVLLAMSTAEALNSFLSIKPDYTILRISSSSTESLAPLTEICEADPQALVIVVGSGADHAFALECIRHGASDYLRMPLKASDLKLSMERLSNRRKMLKKALVPDRGCVQEERKTLRFGNDIDNLPYIINQAVMNASVVCHDIPMLKMALGEVLLNAIEHGNLNITMKEKSAAMQHDSYPELLRKRMEDPLYAGRLVTLHVQINQERLVYRIIDQGTGFDYRNLFKRDPHATAGSGLGLFVVKSFFSRMSFRGKGNEVVLVYTQPKPNVVKEKS